MAIYYSPTYRQYGTWMAESKCENARDIIDKYLKRSLDALGQDGQADVRLKIYHDIAKFADAEYKQVTSFYFCFSRCHDMLGKGLSFLGPNISTCV